MISSIPLVRHLLDGHPLFQSRNRGSFDFKAIGRMLGVSHTWGFNLVIEVLLISSIIIATEMPCAISFNLVIEVLLISRGSDPAPILSISF